MKKTPLIVAFSLCTLHFALSFAEADYVEPALVECSSLPSFGANSCEVCYTETRTAVPKDAGWQSTISEIKIPWKHAGGALDEIIYQAEQKLPEIKTTMKFTTKPEEDGDLWGDHETLVWTPFADHKEAVLKKDEAVGLYGLKDGSLITFEGTKTDDTAMIVTPLSVGDFNSETNEESKPKIRNICVLEKFVLATTNTETAVEAPETTPEPTPAVTEPTITTDEALSTPTDDMATTPATTEEIPDLNSAGPEITAEQTEQKTGPETWIALLLAFAFAGAWSAWKKSQEISNVKG